MIARHGIAAPIALAAFLGACGAPSAPDRAAGGEAQVARSILGPATFEVTDTSAILWAQGTGEGVLHVEVADGQGVVAHRTVPVHAEQDFTGAVRFEGLSPGTAYSARLWFADDAALEPAAGDPGRIAQFRTAPARDAPVAVRFAWSGDLGGQGACRDAMLGYPIFTRLLEQRPDFFIGLGDMIYADHACPEKGLFGNAQVPGSFGPASDLEGYRTHWRYNREDPAHSAFLAGVPYYAVWDDHEIENNAGPDVPLIPVALRAFDEFNPTTARQGGSGPLYRSVRWGRHVELFFLDIRSYRDSNERKDDPTKTLLGQEQMAWLEESVRRSDATWKVIVSGVPVGLTTGNKREGTGFDAWASGESPFGFEAELTRILHMLRDAGAWNSLWLATDVHLAAGFVFTPFAESPQFRIHEAIAGPLSAVLGNRRPVDRTFNPTELFFHAPAKNSVTSFEEARKWLNFGIVKIDEDGTLTVSVISDTGATVGTFSVTPMVMSVAQ